MFVQTCFFLSASNILRYDFLPHWDCGASLAAKLGNQLMIDCFAAFSKTPGASPNKARTQQELSK